MTKKKNTKPENQKDRIPQPKIKTPEKIKLELLPVQVRAILQGLATSELQAKIANELTNNILDQMDAQTKK